MPRSARADDRTFHPRPSRAREHGFEEEHFDAPDHAIYSVGVHRFVGVPTPLGAEQHLFTFIE